MKTYSRHFQLVDEMREFIPQPHFIVFGDDYWEINGIKFQPKLYNKRYEKIMICGEERDDYRFEASVEENVKIYEEERALEMAKRANIPFYKKSKEDEWFNRTGFSWQELFSEK